jgi:hypothetical protein
LNSVVEAQRVVWRAGRDVRSRGDLIPLVVLGGSALVLVGEPCYLDIAKSEFANWPLEHHPRMRPVNGVMIKMGVRRNRDVDEDFRKIREKPLSPETDRIVSPRIE